MYKHCRNSHRKCNKMSQCIQIFISYLCEARHVSGDTPPTIRSLKLHWQPLVLHAWKVVGRVVGGCVQLLQVRQLSTHAKPEAASAVLGSRWWAVCRPKHVELHINMKWKFWYNVASWWIFCVNYTMMHVSTNIKLYKLFQTLWSAVKLLMTDYTYSGVAFCLSQRKVSIKMHSILAVNLDGDWCFQCQQVLEKSW